MSGFHEVQFPPTISYGSSGGPGFNTNIITVDSATEDRVSRWSSARCSYDVVNGIKTQADLYLLIAFFRARMGAAYGFRYKDWSDYASTSDGNTAPNGTQSISHTDCTLGTGDGVATTIQLVKQYISGPTTRTRTITKPVSGTVKVGFDGVNQASGWTVDTATGIVTFTTAPGNGVVITAGFEFDVPVRFGEDVDKKLPIRIEDYRSGSVSVPLEEIIDDAVSQDEYCYGGAIEIASAANMSLSGLTRLWVINMTAAGKSVTLDDPAGKPGGGPQYYVINDGANSFTLKNFSGATLLTVAAGAAVTCAISVDSIGNKYWYCF